MARPEKVAVVERVREDLQAASATVLTEYRGLTVSALQELRRELSKVDADYRVVKNTLARRAVDEVGLDVPDELLTGPTALTVCWGDPVAVAKVLRRFAKDHPELVVKGALMDGELLDEAATRGLADLASRDELLATAAGQMGALIAAPARLADQARSRPAMALAALQRSLEQQEAA